MALSLTDSRVLIVDDNAFNRNSLALVIRRAGVGGIEFAADGEEGLRKVARFQPDLVLLDVDMPVMDGLEMCRRLRQEPEHAELPVLFQTALDGDDEQVRCFEAGGNDFISKPIRPGECVARVRHHLEKRQLFAELSTYRARVQRELAHAQAMQLSLLPDPVLVDAIGLRYGLAIAAHFETSSELGGDLWTVRSLDHRRIGVLVADFAGHGITAAINTFRLHTLIERIPMSAENPAGWLVQLNAALKEVLPVGQFATAFAAVLDVEADTLTYAGAGSPNPAVGTRDGTVRLLDSAGLLLGVSRKAHYVNRTVAMPPGAFLFLYSDALIESRDAAGACFGQPAVADLVRDAAADRGRPLDRLLDRFFARVGRPLRDDLTAVWIARRP
ncbi:PP2C family protein-serine/threonine phosphatase [Azospirillum sp. ST 5-10]|uniref:PP2C family protein-serine/threonine phosphatase n=1 Tax=unclassified Azospirillum TaxID=2630922 RepID=UPI003F4A207B